MGYIDWDTLFNHPILKNMGTFTFFILAKKCQFYVQSDSDRGKNKNIGVINCKTVGVRIYMTTVSYRGYLKTDFHDKKPVLEMYLAHPATKGFHARTR